MGPSFDITEILWQIAQNTPKFLVFLVCGIVLLSKRRVAPRACTMAGIVFLLLFMLNIILHLAAEWVFSGRATSTPGMIPPSYIVGIRILNIVYNVVFAIGMALLTWAVLMERRPVPAADA